MTKPAIDITGQRYGRLTVIGRADKPSALGGDCTCKRCYDTDGKEGFEWVGGTE